MGSTSYGVFHVGTKLNVVPTPSGGANDPFETRIEWCIRQFDEHFLGHSQMTGVQKGVGGKMQGAQAVQQFEDLTNSRLRTFSAQVTNTLAPTLIARNLGPHIAEQHSPIVRLRFEDRDDPEILAKVALTLYQANAGELVGVDDLVRRCLGHVADATDKNLGPAPKGGTGAAPPGDATAVSMHGLSAAEHRQALQALANADTSEFRGIRDVIAGYVSHEKKRALAYGKKRLGRE
jgi:hypothetical protein